jgi:hypothetical protein
MLFLLLTAAVLHLRRLRTALLTVGRLIFASTLLRTLFPVLLLGACTVLSAMGFFAAFLLLRLLAG